MAASAMPGSFAPSLPSLPSYPRHLAPSPPSFASHHSIHPSKKRLQRSFPSPAPTPPPLSAEPDSEDDNMMSNSFYSDRGYRSSLTLPPNRKRGLADDDADDYRRGGGGGTSAGASADSSDERAGKRRIIDVVGGTLGGALRGMWEFCKPRIPFYGNASSPTEPLTPAPTPVTPQRGFGDESQGAVHSSVQMQTFSEERRRHEDAMPGQIWTGRDASEGVGGGGGGGFGNAFGIHSNGPFGAGMMDMDKDSNMNMDTGMNARWVMVSPAEASTASPRPQKRQSYVGGSGSGSTTPTSARRPRPVVSSAKRRGLRPPVQHRPAAAPLYSPPPTGQFTFGMSSSTASSAGMSMSGSRRAPQSGSGKRVHRRGTLNGNRGSSGTIEDEEDEDIRRFNERLKAMIREGKEALGSTVEVVYDDDDEF